MKNTAFSLSRYSAFFPLFVIMILVSSVFPLVHADFGNEDDYLGQVVDDYENADNIAAMIDTINNETTDCMELNYTAGVTFLDYTEVDGSGDLAVIVDRISWNTMRRDADAYVYYDYGVDYFEDFILNFTLVLSDIEAGGISSRDILCVYRVGNGYGSMSDYPIIGNTYLQVLLKQDTSVDDRFSFRLQHVTAGVVKFTDNTATMGISTFYLSLQRSGNDVDLYIFSDEGHTVSVDVLSGVGDSTKYRYEQPVTSRDQGTDPGDHSTGYVEWEFGAGYSATGVYYTVNVLDGDPALAIQYTATIPAGTGMTMEFSTDNVTWVDHNNEAGADILKAGYETLDLRDIYNGTTYRRVNSTSNGADTPRMFQEVLITVTDQPSGEGGDARPEGWVLTVMIAAIAGTLIILGTRRRK